MADSGHFHNLKQCRSLKKAHLLRCRPRLHAHQGPQLNSNCGATPRIWTFLSDLQSVDPRPGYSFMWGSSQSRRALPIKLMTRVVTKMARPGKAAIHQEFSM